MKILATLLLLLMSAEIHAQPLSTGDYVLIRGAVNGCESWPSRILEVEKIETEAPVVLLGLSGVEVVGLNKVEIEKELRKTIENLTGHHPSTLVVEILRSEMEYQSILREYSISLKALIAGHCPHPDADPYEPIRKPSLEEQIEQLRRAEIARLVV